MAPFHRSLGYVNPQDLATQTVLPKQTDKGGKFLMTNGATPSWETPGSTGSNQIVPVNSPAQSNNFLTAYDNSTGAWSRARPTWANIDKSTSNLADITTRSHASLTDVGTNTHSQIDSHISATTSAHGGIVSSTDPRLSNARTPTSHTHVMADVTDLVILGSKTVLTLGSDVPTAANVNPVSLTGLAWSFQANSKYLFKWIGRVSPAAATTGCGFQIDVSAAVTSIDMIFYHQLANTGTTSGGHSIADDASVGVSSGLPGTSTYPVVGDGLLVTGANAGTAQLRFRSETTAVITAKAGMVLVVEKIA